MLQYMFVSGLLTLAQILDGHSILMCVRAILYRFDMLCFFLFLSTSNRFKILDVGIVCQYLILHRICQFKLADTVVKFTI